MRLVKSVDHYLDAQAALEKPGPSWLRGLNAVNELNKSLRMVFDHVQWAGNIGLLGPSGRDAANRIGNIANFFWFVGLLTSLGLDVYGLEKEGALPLPLFLASQGQRSTGRKASQARSAAAEAAVRRRHTHDAAPGHPLNAALLDDSGDAAADVASATSARRQRVRKLTLDLLRDLCDLPVPSFSLGLTPAFMSTGHVGLSGSLSSLIGLYQVWSGVVANMTKAK